MNQWLSEDQLQVQELTRRLARERVAQRARDIDRSAEYPEDMFALLKELGLFTLPFPTQYGGANSLLSACVAVEELGHGWRGAYSREHFLLQRSVE